MRILPGLPAMTVCLLTLFNGLALVAQETVAQETVAQEMVAQEMTAAPEQVTGEESLMDNSVPSHEKVWLNYAGRKELAFYLSETSGKAHGGVLLLPDLGYHPATGQGMIHSLRHSLSNNHWHTLAIDMSATSEETSRQMIAAGIDYLNQQGVFNIAILGEGVGATQALHYVAALPAAEEGGQLQPIRALLMLNANNMVPGSPVNTLEQLSQIKLPVLDAYLSGDYIEQQRADERKRAARRLMTGKGYQQIRLPQASGYQQNQDNRITKRIRGWLDKNVAGFMVDQ